MYFRIRYMFLVCATFVLTQSIAKANCDVQAVLEDIGRYKAIHTLGWDPYYALYSDERELVNAQEVTIFCHGMGQNQLCIPTLQQRQLLVGTVIGFDFEDAVYGKHAPDYTKTSFGQEHETQALLYLLKHLDDAGMERFHLYGYSRGGAVVLNTIKQLICYVEHKALFKKLGISQHQAHVLLKKIQAGTVILDCPLLDMRVVTKKRSPYFYWFFDMVVCPLRTGCKYAPWKDQGIKSASYCKHLDLALLVHFQEPDKIVTNQLDEKFYEIIEGPRTHKVVGNEGHFHTGIALAPEIREFNEKYGAAYRE